jgi:hypothetical protein
MYVKKYLVPAIIQKPELSFFGEKTAFSSEGFWKSRMHYLLRRDLVLDSRVSTLDIISSI